MPTREETARQFLARVKTLVADYHNAAKSRGSLADAIRHAWTDERKRGYGQGAGFDRGAIREYADQEKREIEHAWPMDKPPSVRMLYEALNQVVDLCR